MDHITQKLKSGLRCQREGRPEAAQSEYEAVLAEQPRNVHALNLLGALYINTGKPRDAINLIRQALKIQPEDPQALVNLALAEKDLGQYQQAAAHLEKSLDIRSDNAHALNCLGSVLLELGNPERAINCYKKAVKLQPDFVDCLVNLSTAYKSVDKLEKAAKTGLEAQQRAPQLLHTNLNLAAVYRAKSEFDSAIRYFKRALEITPGKVDTWIDLANTYREQANPSAAMRTLSRLLEREPRSNQAYCALGVLQEQEGDKTAAAESFKKAIAFDPTSARPHYYLAQLKGRPSTPEETAAVKTLADNEEQSEDNRFYGLFALAVVSEQEGDLDAAFSAWRRAHAMRADRKPYDHVARNKFYNDIVEHITAAVNQLDGSRASPDARPLFIVGMPRSGTTLTGQIISRHSSVYNLGEVSSVYDMAMQVAEIAGVNYPTAIAKLSDTHLSPLSQILLSRFPGQWDGAYVLDNTPTNFQHLGLAALVFPQARFIHCHRDPIDTCFSIFKLPFGAGQDYAHDLIWLGRQYRSYHRLMTAWRGLFADRILDVGYEDTVSDLNSQVRRICRFLDVPLEPEMLEFHRSKNLVRTPSASQVREPIYKNAVGAWRAYEKQLQPLIETLGDLALTD